jgi:hypothetical protein
MGSTPSHAAHPLEEGEGNRVIVGGLLNSALVGRTTTTAAPLLYIMGKEYAETTVRGSTSNGFSFGSPAGPGC